MKKLFGILSVMLCATSMSYAQADGSAALQSSDVEMTWNGAVKEKKVIKSGSCGANVKYELYDDYTLRIYGSGEMSKFLYWGDGFLHDTSVPWIYEIKKIKSVVIEDGVTNIGDESFNDCSALTKVSIPNSVKSIGYAAFRECYALTKVTIPNSVNHIAECAFYGCRSLAEVNLPNGITSIENDVFNGCAFTELKIPSSVTSIGECTFCSCPFTEITIPSNVKSVGKSAFYDCPLEKVNISNGVTSIGDYALSGYNMEYVKIGKDVTKIGDQVFPQYYDENLVIEFTSETPATLYSVESFGFLCTIYVPENALETYLNAEFWKDHADQILPREQATGISSVGSEQSEKETAIYDLQGRKVTELQPNGMYIVNGKKIVMK